MDLNERINKENNALLAQVFKINNDLQKAWSLWHDFHNYGFYMGCTNGPTVETSGSIVLAPQPSEVGLETSEVWAVSHHLLRKFRSLFNIGSGYKEKERSGAGILLRRRRTVPESLIDGILHALLAQASNLKMSKMFDSLEVQNCTNNCLLDL